MAQPNEIVVQIESHWLRGRQYYPRRPRAPRLTRDHGIFVLPPIPGARPDTRTQPINRGTNSILESRAMRRGGDEEMLAGLRQSIKMFDEEALARTKRKVERKAHESVKRLALRLRIP
jgi:hypothetical protein